MIDYFKLDLRLFADGDGSGNGAAAAEGADAAETGDNTDSEAAARERLRALGVPESKIRKNGRYAKPSASAPQAPEQAEAAPAAEENGNKPQQETGRRMTWDEILADPEYNKSMQATVQNRLRSAKGAEERLQKLAPVLEALGAKYSIDTTDIGKLDIDALIQSVNDDDSYYENIADERGLTVQQAREIDRLEKFRSREEAQRKSEFEMQRTREHYNRLVQQGEALKQTFPSFDLETELQNPTFFRMTSPNGGVSVEDAYFAIHHKEIQTVSMQIAAQNVQRKLANAVQANAARPAENGSHAASLTSVDYRNMSRQQREQLKSDIRRAAARGEKIYPGQYRKK